MRTTLPNFFRKTLYISFLFLFATTTTSAFEMVANNNDATEILPSSIIEAIGKSFKLYDSSLTNTDSYRKTIENSIITSTAFDNNGLEVVARLKTNYEVGDVDCYGGNNGYATVYITGGTEPYTYQWSHGATTQTIENLAAGTYRLAVEDADGNRTNCRVRIKEPSKLNHSITKLNDASAYGSSDGSARVRVNGGTRPYTYAWDNGETTDIATALNAGQHTVTITDANGCTTECSVVIDEPEPEPEDCVNDADCDGIPVDEDCDDTDPNNTNTIPDAPTNLACYQEATYNPATCSWDITGTQEPEPTKLNCWDDFVFDDATCTWENQGTQDPNDADCDGVPVDEDCDDTDPNNTNTIPDAPTNLACYQEATYNPATCSWDITGTQEPEPAMVNCWDDFVFDDATCTWENQGAQDPNDADCDGLPVDEDCDDTDPNNTNTIPDAPTNLACYQEATYNPATCSWDITGTQEPEPTKLNCWDDFVFDDATCTWENQGTQDPNDADCDGVPVDEDCDDTDPNNTNTIPDAPTNLACYQEATYNPATCSWDISGTQEPKPAKVNCWDDFVFDDATCTWENQGTQDPNDADCDGLPVDEDCDDTDPNNTNTIPDAPTNLACYQEATYNPATCSWDITGTQEPEPAMVNCWDDFVFDDATCSWENQGTQDPKDADCDGIPVDVDCDDTDPNNTNTIPDAPTNLACYQEANYNPATCSWDITGTQELEPAMVNCWDDFVFDDATCTWENQGTQDPNDADCDGIPVDEDCDDTDPNNTNTIPDAPTNLACYQEATYNPATCSWDISGTQEPEPAKVNCWDDFVFDDATCSWENQGAQDPNDADCDGVPVDEDCDDTDPNNTNTIPDAPTNLACYQEATYNPATCSWDITGTQEPEPAMVNCWDDFVFDDATCSWENQGTQDPNDADCDGIPVDVDCDDTDPNNTNTIPDAPTNLACYQEATYNPASCSWDITGTQEPEPTDLECGKAAEFNTNTCEWDIIDTEEDCTEPPIGCETAFARYDDGGVEDEIDEPNDGRCFEDDGFQRWGWTNLFSATGTYHLQLYSGAGQCGFLNRQSGNVTVVWENNMVTVSINLLPGFEMQQAHLYVGGNDYPTIQRGPNTVETVAPGQYPYQDGEGVNPEITTPVTSYTFNPVDVTGLSEIYVIAHAVTCEVEEAAQEEEESLVQRQSSLSSMTVFQKPQSKVLSVDLDISYDAEVNTSFQDLSGRTVLTAPASQVSAGNNHLEYDLGTLPTEVLIMKVYTGREIISKKVLIINK